MTVSKSGVGPAGVSEALDELVEGGVAVDTCRLQGGELRFEAGQLAGKLALLLPGDVGWNDSVHSVLGPLVAIALDLVDAALQRVGVARGVVLHIVEELVEPRLEVWQRLDAPVGVLVVPDATDGVLNAFNGEVRRVAVG